MEYLVESHLGGYYISDLDPEVITAYCESCGDSDYILLSWEEGHMMDALLKYFEEITHPIDNIKSYLNVGVTKKDFIDKILCESFDNRIIIDTLFEQKYINDDEYKNLLEVNHQTHKNQISLVCEIYPHEDRKVLMKRKNIKK